MSKLFLDHKYGDISVYTETNDFVSVSQNLKQQRITNNAHQWVFDISFTGGKYTNIYGDFITHYNMHKNNIFDLVVPNFDKDEDRIVSPQAVLVSTLAAGGVSIINITSADTFIIPKNLFITFSNHGKLYRVTQDVNGVADTPTELMVTPRLHNSVSIGAEVKLKDVVMKAYHRRENSRVAISGHIESARWSFEEAL